MKEPSLDVGPSTRSREWIIAHAVLDEQSTQEACEAQVLLVPEIGFRKMPEPAFPVGTDDLWLFLKENAPPSLKLGICCSDESYHELALHDATLRIALVLVSYVFAPLAINLLAAYIARKIFDPADTDVEFEMLTEETDGERVLYQSIRYKGPAANFKPTMIDALAKCQRLGQGGEQPTEAANKNGH